MALKSNYSNLTDAVTDIKTLVTGGITDDVDNLTVNFVRWNEDNMFEDTGQSISDVKSQTDYKRGIVIGKNPYFAFVYYGTKNIPAGGKTGKPRPFEYTWEHRISDIEKLELGNITKRL